MLPHENQREESRDLEEDKQLAQVSILRLSGQEKAAVF